MVAAQQHGNTPQVQFGNPWHLLDALMSRYELLDEMMDNGYPQTTEFKLLSKFRKRTVDETGKLRAS